MFRLRCLKRYRPLFAVSAVLFVWTFGSGVLWFFLPKMVEGFFSDVKMVGLMVALPSILSLVVDLPAGDMVDKLGRRKVMLLAFGMLALLGIGLLHVSSGIQMAAFLVGLGLVYQTVYISALAYMMDVSPRDKFSTALGFQMSAIHLGFGLGPVAGGLVILMLGLGMAQTAALMYALCCVLALIMTAMILREDNAGSGVVESIKSVILKDKIIVKEIIDYKKLKNTGLVVLYLTFILTFYDGVVWLIQPLYYTTFSQNPLYGGLIMAAFVIPLVLFEIPAGFLADRFGRRRILFLGLLVAGASSILFSFAGGFIALFLTAFAATTGIAMAWPSSEGVLSAKTPSAERGEVAGVWSLAYDLGYVAGPLAAGILASYVGEAKVFAVLGCMMVASAFSVLAIKD